MAEIAKLRERDRRIWEAVCRYANDGLDVTTLVAEGMNWIGGDYDDIQLCEDVKREMQAQRLKLTSSNQPEVQKALESLAKRYRPEVRNVLSWLSAPEQNRKLAIHAAEFLREHGTQIRMHVGGNSSFVGEDSKLLSEYWPDRIGSVVSPVCKFVLDQIERHDTGNKQLRDVIPIGSCKRCGRFFLIERVGRKAFCSNRCRSGFRQDQMTPEQKAERMRKYRARVKEIQGKRKRFAKKGKGGK